MRYSHVKRESLPAASLCYGCNTIKRCKMYTVWWHVAPLRIASRFFHSVCGLCKLSNVSWFVSTRWTMRSLQQSERSAIRKALNANALTLRNVTAAVVLIIRPRTITQRSKFAPVNCLVPFASSAWNKSKQHAYTHLIIALFGMSIHVDLLHNTCLFVCWRPERT